MTLEIVGSSEHVAQCDARPLKVFRTLHTQNASSGRQTSLTAMNMSQMQRVEGELQVLQRQLYSNDESRMSIKATLATVEPTAPMRLANGQMVAIDAPALAGSSVSPNMWEDLVIGPNPSGWGYRRLIESP